MSKVTAKKKKKVPSRSGPTGPCDFCKKPWVFVIYDRGLPVERRCEEHRLAPT